MAIRVNGRDGYNVAKPTLRMATRVNGKSGYINESTLRENIQVRMATPSNGRDGYQSKSLFTNLLNSITSKPTSKTETKEETSNFFFNLRSSFVNDIDYCSQKT